MIIDTSALVAMLTNEPEAERFEVAVEADPALLMSTASYLETAIVIENRFGKPGGRELDCGSIVRRLIWWRCTPSKPTSRGWPTASMGRAVIGRA
jgi:uncharacterized protein with PIN domain